MSQRVLMVLYHFPPLGGVSMPRAVRNVQYLPRHGWTPIALTPRNAAWEPKDPSSLALLPADLAVIRTDSIEAGHVRAAAVRVRDRIAAGPAARSAGDLSTDGVRPPAAAGGPSSLLAGHSGRAARLRHLLFFPDDEIGWLPFAVAAALRVHRSEPFQAIYSSSFPITAHVVAGVFKHLTGVPWVAEFRDPWQGNVLAVRQPWFQRRLQLKLERWIVRSADRVVTVTPTLTRMYQERYPGADIRTITNGYDRTEAPAPGPARPADGRFRIVYTGTLDRPAELDAFLGGVDRLVARRPDLREGLEIVFYGPISDACRAVAQGYTEQGHLGDVARIAGLVSRQLALAAVAEADAALVLLGSGPGMDLFVGGKLYDYLGQNRQILAMVPRGDARDVLAGLGWGVIADPTPESVEAAVERLISQPAPAGPADPTGRFDRAALAAELAALLDDVAPAPILLRQGAGQ
jgi:glycosyltransferase involved in cell wall biosynthesis